MQTLTSEELRARDERDIRDLNFAYWMIVQRRAERDWQDACSTFGLDRTLVQRLARMSVDEIRGLVDRASPGVTHFVHERNKALELLWALVEAEEDSAKIEATRIAAVVQSLQSRISD